MATIPSPAGTAKIIVDALVADLGLRAGHAVPIRVLKARTRARGVHDEDLVAGLEYAVNKESWIEDGDSSGFIRLTAAGFLAASQPSSSKQHGAPIQNRNSVAGEGNTSSHHQSGGITAHIVNIHGPTSPARPEAEKSPWWTSWWWVILLGVMTILAGLVPTLEYFHIEWPRQLEQKQSTQPSAAPQPAQSPVPAIPVTSVQSPEPGMLPTPTRPMTEIPVETETRRPAKAVAMPQDKGTQASSLGGEEARFRPPAFETLGLQPLKVQIIGNCKHAAISEQNIRAAILSSLERNIDARSIIVKIVAGTEDGISEGSGTSVKVYGHYTLCRGEGARDCPDPPLECDSGCRYSSGDSLTINRELAIDRLGQAIAREIAAVSFTQSPAKGAICGP